MTSAWRVVAVLILIFSILWIVSKAVTSSKAQTRASLCHAHEKIVETLREKYKETLHGIGTQGGQYYYEFFLSDAGTWTLVRTDTKGQSCMVNSGTNWTFVEPKKGEPL